MITGAAGEFCSRNDCTSWCV